MNTQNNEALTLDVKFKVKDVLRYNASVARKNIVNCLIIALGLGVLVYFFYKMFTSGERMDIFVARHIVLLVVPVLIFIMIPWRVWKITLTQMQQPAFAYGVVYTFSKEHIVLDIGEASEAINWDVFAKIIETKNDFRFYVNHISAQIIPKHNMTSEQLQELRKMIGEVAPDRSQLR
ncbi:MAG: YcxB family protein [Cellulosilyticum sp.]|nr:YcxB family protein [Cellulosilyticum sp.]